MEQRISSPAEVTTDFGEGHSQMIKFVLLTTQRSGATFFLKCLASHPQIACRHETVFSQDNKFKFFSFDRPSSFYYKYRIKSRRRRLAHWLRRKQLIFDCLDDYWYTLPNDVTATGLKISYNQIEKYPAIATWINERDIRIVHLVRKNILKTVLSLETAKRRGLSHATHEVELVKVQLNPNKLKRNLIRRTKQVDRFRNMFVNKPYLEIAYEDLVANQNGITQNVLQFLDIDDFVTLQTDLVKLNPDTIQDIVENYDEVAETLRDTVFEKYL